MEGRTVGPARMGRWAKRCQPAETTLTQAGCEGGREWCDGLATHAVTCCCVPSDAAAAPPLPRRRLRVARSKGCQCGQACPVAEVGVAGAGSLQRLQHRQWACEELGRMVLNAVCNLAPHTSHLTPHTSHLTPHTSHLTPQTSLLTCISCSCARLDLSIDRPGDVRPPAPCAACGAPCACLWSCASCRTRDR